MKREGKHSRIDPNRSEQLIVPQSSLNRNIPSWIDLQAAGAGSLAGRPWLPRTFLNKGFLSEHQPLYGICPGSTGCLMCPSSFGHWKLQKLHRQCTVDGFQSNRVFNSPCRAQNETQHARGFGAHLHPRRKVIRQHHPTVPDDNRALDKCTAQMIIKINPF